MRRWCEECGGSGKIRVGGIWPFGRVKTCAECNGDGAMKPPARRPDMPMSPSPPPARQSEIVIRYTLPDHMCGDNW